jgi:hypothetical protein
VASQSSANPENRKQKKPLHKVSEFFDLKLHAELGYGKDLVVEGEAFSTDFQKNEAHAAREKKFNLEVEKYLLARRLS